ncbi:MAG: hypothetical protein Q9226_007923, partial [Calogaya cf. arnoldii]
MRLQRLTAPVPECFDAYKIEAVQSVVDCLSNLLPLSLQYELARAEGKEVHRTETERDALELLYIFLLRFSVPVALDCDICGLWLEKYPFGGDLESQYPGDKNSQLAARSYSLMNRGSGREQDPDLFRVLNLIFTAGEAEESRLRDLYTGHSYLHGREHNDEPDDDEHGFSQAWNEIHGTANPPDPGWVPMARTGNRVREESIEEQALRRRRREAMVLGEMGRPLESEDIIQR